MTKWLLLGLVLAGVFFVSGVDGSINPKPHLRVIPIKLGGIVLVEEPAASLFCAIITVMCAYNFYLYHKVRKSHPILDKYPFHCLYLNYS
jgi:hypothetical protein